MKLNFLKKKTLLHAQKNPNHKQRNKKLNTENFKSYMSEAGKRRQQTQQQCK